jgi:hypothetical protein
VVGRESERARLRTLLADGGALVVRGEPGVGKSMLLEWAVLEAGERRVLRATGVESETELAYAGLHALLHPVLGLLDRLSDPHAQALACAFGLREGHVENRFLVSLATHGLLGLASESAGVLCIVDDAQWLDHASAQVLGFVARRLLAEPVAMVFAERDPRDDRELRSLPVMVLEGLSDEDARALLDSATPGRLDERVRDRIVAEANGNPLALLELPKGLTPNERSAHLAADTVRPFGPVLFLEYGRLTITEWR